MIAPSSSTSTSSTSTASTATSSTADAAPSAPSSSSPSSTPPSSPAASSSALSSSALLPQLTRLGWDDRWAAAVPDGHELSRLGRVSRGDLRACDVLVAAPDGLRTVRATWSPQLDRSVGTDPTALPAAGDWVLLDAVAQAGADLMVREVLPRRTAVTRAQVAGTSQQQVLAANADVAVVVEGMVPDLDPARVERFLTLAWSSGAQPLVVLTKGDLAPDPDAAVLAVRGLAPGVDVLATDAPRGHGLDPLHALLAGGATIALLGASGVGKSTLLNALVAGPGGDGPMQTRSLGAENKGRHTTVTRELHLGPAGGAVLDTPGLRTVGLASDAVLEDVFPEVDELARQCRFGDCEHRTEPGCAVLAAVEAGDLPERRLHSYRKLVREAEHQAARTDARLRAELGARVRAQGRAYRRAPKRR